MSANGRTAVDMKFIPIISTAKPTKMLPMDLLRSFLHSIVINTPMTARMGEKFSGFSI